MIICIKKNEFEEYELPTEPESQAIYYTDCKQDALDTAYQVWGEAAVIRVTRGSYGVIE